MNCDIADVILYRQADFPKEPYDEPYYNPVDKKYQTRTEVEKNFWLGCETVTGCGDSLRDKTAPFEAKLGVDKYYLRNIFKYPVIPNDLPYNEPQFAYTETQWIEWKDIFATKYHYTINDKIADSWETHYYQQTNKAAKPTTASNKAVKITSFNERYRSIDYGVEPLRLMYKVGSTWVQDSFTSSEKPFVTTATPSSYVIPSNETSTTYDKDITFSLPEYSGLTEVNYVWNTRQIESGLTVKMNIKQKKKTGTAKFNDGNTITIKGIGSVGTKGVKPLKNITYTGDYKDNVNDTISWVNKTSGFTPATGDFTDETHADSAGLNDNIRITSSQTWVENKKYDINHWEATLPWWKEGEGGSARTSAIIMAKYDPRLDIVVPYQFNIVQNPPVVKYCYYFSSLSANNLTCSGGNVSASVGTTIRKKYHDYSICEDNTNEYYISETTMGWSISPSSIPENTTCLTKYHTITATQNESGLQLSTSISQSYDCLHHDYINSCSASPSSIGYGGGSGSISANALYYDRTCSVNYNNSDYSPKTFTFGANTSQSPKTHQITVSNAGSATCTVSVSQAGAPPPVAGCSSNTGYEFGASVSPSSVSCNGGTVTITVSASKKLADPSVSGSTDTNVAWSGTGGGSGTGSGSYTYSIPATSEDKVTSIVVSGAAGTCDLSVSQSGCGTDPEPTGGTCTISVSPSSFAAVCNTTSSKVISVTSSSAWTSKGNGGCSASPSTGTGNNSNVTISIPSGTTAGSVVFTCSDGNTATFNVSRSGEGCSGGGAPDHSCCEMAMYIRNNINHLTYEKQEMYMYILYSCDKGTPKPWEVYGVPYKTAIPSWVHFASVTGAGFCNPAFDCSKKEPETVIANTPDVVKVLVTIDENTTGVERRFDWGYSLSGHTCGYDNAFFSQSAKPADTGCTDCYVAFSNSRTVTMEAAGGTLSNEGIVHKMTGTGCTINVDNINIDSTDGNGNTMSVSPSSGNINSCNITIPENTSTSDRTITITIHPNIDEKKACTVIKTFSNEDNTKVFSDWEIYSDYNEHTDLDA